MENLKLTFLVYINDVCFALQLECLRHDFNYLDIKETISTVDLDLLLCEFSG